MKLTTALILAVFGVASSQAMAGHHLDGKFAHKHDHQCGHASHHHKSKKKSGKHARHEPVSYSYRDERGEYGRVLSVEPVYRTYTRPVRNPTCLKWQPERAQHVSYTGTVLGAVIGGALGHRIGDAHGDPKAAAVAGGLLGASIGRNIDHNVRYNSGVHVAGPCRVRQREETVRELVEYKVTYRYNGHVHHARMDHHPGEWVKLDVQVSPA